MANRRGLADRARGSDRGDSYVVPGIYAAWHLSAAASGAQWDVDRDRDPRFRDPDEPFNDDDDYQAKLAEARVIAEAAAAERIKGGERSSARCCGAGGRWSRGGPRTGVSVSRGHPFSATTRSTELPQMM